MFGVRTTQMCCVMLSVVSFLSLQINADVEQKFGIRNSWNEGGCGSFEYTFALSEEDITQKLKLDIKLYSYAEGT